MKKLILLLCCTPFLSFSQNISIRTFPVYLGFYWSPDLPYIGSTIGVDYHIDEKKSISTNFTIKSIDLNDNSAVVYDWVIGKKNYSKKDFFLTQNIRICVWDENDAEYWDYDTIYINQTNRIAIGPEISFGKRIYFSSYKHFFLECSMSFAIGGYLENSINKIESIDEESYRLLIEEEKKKTTGLYLAPNLLIQIGYRF